MAYDYIRNTGVIIPDTFDTRSAVEQEWKDALNRQDLVTTPDTPQGVLITAETITRQSIARNNAELANQINPELATGMFLDAICGLTGLERRKASKTFVRAVTLSGVANTNIPAGVRARTDAGDIFALLHPVVLDATGAGTGNFEAVEYGAVYCAAGDLAFIVDKVLGWETITNPTSGVLGEPEETDEQLYMRRRLTLARQGISTVEAQVSGLYDLPGVKSLQYRENVTSQTADIDGITMAPHSVWACVDGGTDMDVARSLLNNKTDGAGWNGAVSVSVVEEWSGQTYTVLFDRPTEIPIMAEITVRSAVEVDPQTAVRDSIMAYVNGLHRGERGLMVGQNVSPFEFSGAINREFPLLHVANVRLALVGDDWQTGEIAIAINEKATITVSSIMVIAT